jgi:hypothetical protein
LSACSSSHPRDLAISAGNYPRKSDRFCGSGENYSAEPEQQVTHKSHRRNRKRQNVRARPEL